MRGLRYERFFAILLLITGYVNGAVAQTVKAGKAENLFSVGLGLQHGTIFAHSPAVENTKGSRPTGIEAMASWQRTDSSIFALCNCYPRKGVMVAYYNYDNDILGKSINAAYFLEPLYRLGKNSFFSFRATAGLSYLTNPFDSVRNPSNRSYSTRVSAYLLVGAGLWFRLGDQWWLNPSLNYQHISNGGLKEPNKGINWPTAGLTVGYQKNKGAFYKGDRSKEKFWKGEPLRWDATLLGMARNGQDEEGIRRHFLLIGLSVQAAKQVGRINNLTAGAEIYRDAELKVALKKDSINASPLKAGLLAGHEFILGRFLFSQQLGLYLFDQTPYYDKLYHRWGLHYRAGDHLGIGFRLKAHRHVADFVDVRVVYSWQKKKRK